MYNFDKLYKPITATPFRNDDTYVEVTPSNALKPYIRCFWGTEKPITKVKSDRILEQLIIPDTCMDIIFDVNFTHNQVSSCFHGIDDKTFRIYHRNDKAETVSTFGIRFYAWAAILFSEESMVDVKNNFFDVGYHFSSIKEALEPLLFDKTTMSERVEIAEKVLLENLHIARMNDTFGDAMFQLLRTRGNIKISHLTSEIHISSRQLERIFKENMGISPKQLASLIRYQCLWSDTVLCNQLEIGDAVLRYGYTDQSHLLHDFKKHHTVLPKEARQYAYNQKLLGID